MIKDIADITFFAASSLLSTWFYITRMSGKYTVRRTAVYIFVTVLLSHMIKFLPLYGGNENIFDLLQAAAEGIIVIALMDNKLSEKLIAYMELNAAFAAGMLAAYAVSSPLRSGGAFAGGDIYVTAIFYITVILTAALICGAFILLHGRIRRTDSLMGTGVSVCVSLAMLGFMYVTAVITAETKSSLKPALLFALLGFAVIAYILMKINERIRIKEDIDIKYYVTEKLERNKEQLVKRMQEEERKSREELEFIRSELERAYEIVNGNNAAAAILRIKCREAYKRGIRVETDIAVSPRLMVSDSDCTIIIGNLIDNAMEAAEKIEDGREAFVRITAKLSGDSFYLAVENSYNTEKNAAAVEALAYSDTYSIPTTKADKENHGIGLGNVRAAAARYGLSVRAEAEEDVGVFRVTVDI